MSFELPNSLSRSRTSNGAAWSGTAFIVEAMLLLFFLIGSYAIFTQLFAASTKEAADSEQLSRAVALATARAEEFASDPLSVESSEVSDDLLVKCAVEPETHANGTLYEAEISVYRADAGVGSDSETDEALYAITTSRYVSAGASSATSAGSGSGVN